jgi:hypothetical protein
MICDQLKDSNKLSSHGNHESGTVGAMCDYIIDNIHGGQQDMYPEVLRDVQKVIAGQYSVKDEELSLFIKINDL